MSRFTIVRLSVVLAVCLVVGHSALLWGRDALLAASVSSHGRIGVDAEGRVRRWIDTTGGPGVRFLPSDEVDPGGEMGFVDWYHGGTGKLLAEIGRCRPIPGARLQPMYATERIELVETPESGWRTKGRETASPHRGGRKLFVVEGEEFDELIHAADRFLGLGADGKTLLTADLDGDEIQAVRRTRLDRPRVGRRTMRGTEVEPGEKFAGVVGDEYWVIDRDGRFEQRQPLGVRFRDLFGADETSGKSAYVAYAGRPRPDRVPLRVVVARPGAELITRDIALEPETPYLATLDLGIGLLATMRPLPLNVYAATQLGAGSIESMLVHYWEDPLFGGGANLGWLFGTFVVSLLCALIARRWARRRAPHAVWPWTIMVFLLGPIGLLWMRLVIPWVAVEDGRAVDSESPDWPEPASTGTEVFA